MKTKLLFTCIPLLSLLLITSCIDMEADISIDETGAGRIVMNYSVSKMVMELGQVDEKDPFVPLPVTDTDFIATAAQVPGLELISVGRKTTPQTVDIESEMAFDSVEALSVFLAPGEDTGLTLSETGGETVFRYVLFTAAEEPPNDQSMELINSFFAEDTIGISLEAPSPVVSAEPGTVDGRTASFEISIQELFTQNRDVIWEVRW